MKKVLLALALVVFAASNSFAAATAEKKMEFGVNAGLNLLLSPSGITDAFGMGFGGGAFGRYILNPKMSLGVAVNYNMFGGKDGNEGDLSLLTILAQGKMKMGKGSAKPYLLGGLGFCRSSYDVPAYHIPGYGTVGGGSVSATDLMLEPGFGVEFGSKTKFFVEGRLSIVMADGDTLMALPINAGVQF